MESDSQLENYYSTKPALRDISELISKRYKVGSNLESEIKLAENVQYSPQTVRESLIILESFGFVEITPRLNTKLISCPQSSAPSCPDSILKKKLNVDIKFKNFVKYLRDRFKIGQKLPGQRVLARLNVLSPDTVRTFNIRLECAGYLSMSGQGKRRTILKELPNIYFD